MATLTWRRRAHLCLTFAALGTLSACGGDDDATATVPAADPLVRTTAFGKVEGLANTASATYAWLGIPYAQPPVGALRWMPPKEPSAWTMPLATKAFGRSCAQPGSFYAPPKADDGFSRDIANTFGQVMGAEDCLSLNIWRPASDAAQLPVIVWFHGGANTVGYTSNPGYNGANFARINNAIVVSVNYRLGVFGWLRHPALRVDGDSLANSGNFGTLDQIKALEFVHNNIAAFGGDPANVTVMGQSAGAVDIYSLMVSPLTKDKGYFHKAVAMSGGLRLNTLARSETYAQSVLSKVLVLGNKATADNVATVIAGMSPAQVAQALREATPEILVLTSSGQADNIADGTVLPESVEAAIASGAYTNVPLISGMTGDESKMFMQSSYKVNDAQRFLMMFDFDPENPTAAGAPSVADILKPEVTVESYNATAAATTAATYGALANQALSLLWPRQPKVYAYHWLWSQGPEPWKTLYGAGHGMDVPFMFGNFGKGLFSVNYTLANAAGREALSEAMMRSVGAFMRTGDPNHPALGTTWAPWTPSAPKRLIFNATLTDKQIAME
ncbi:carboxylesterase/lipase family protein [Rhizobacter sp. LjRoot28]|uniref:carboxylesterase/lipase family protein n=1 Tax=Rhizobacter sp. LjRoot28 TaxID=3342309 RepID=UPI003ED11A08